MNAVNTAVKAAEESGFAILRPPGHHAAYEAEGFCYFNNIVIALENIYHGKKVAILDLDAHYGNGTHQLVKNRRNVLYLSIHADVERFYPFRRIDSENAILIDVEPKKINDAKFLSYVKIILAEIKKFQPDVLAISMGFDTWYADPVLGFNVKRFDTYYKIGEMIKTLGIPVFGILEGGYSSSIGVLVQYFLAGLGFLPKHREIEKPKIVFSFKKKPNAKYLINPAGEILEVIQQVRQIGKISKKEGYVYQIVDDHVVEKPLVTMSVVEYYKKKETGEITELIRKGVEIEIIRDDMPLEALVKLQDEYLRKQLFGRKIVDVKIMRKSGKRMLVLRLDNDRRLILREGLLAGGAVIEIE